MKRLPSRSPEPLAVPTSANHCWSIDFMSDSLFCGRRFWMFNVVDDFNRKALAIEPDLNLPAPRVIRVLERISAWRGYLIKLRMDNRPEFISLALANWAEEQGISLDLSSREPQPRTPTLSASTAPTAVILNLYVFKKLPEVRELTEKYMHEYNDGRPHDSLNDLTLWEYLAKHNQLGNSNRRCD